MVLPAVKVCAFGGTMPRGVPTARQPGFSPPLPFTSLRFFFRELSPKTPTSSEFTSRDPPLRGGYALLAAPEVGASPVHQKGGFESRSRRTPGLREATVNVSLPLPRSTAQAGAGEAPCPPSTTASSTALGRTRGSKVGVLGLGTSRSTVRLSGMDRHPGPTCSQEGT